MTAKNFLPSRKSSATSRGGFWPSCVRCFLIAVAAMLMGGCGPDPEAENKRLTAELEKTKKELSDIQTKKTPDQILRDANDCFARGDFHSAKLACDRLTSDFSSSPAAHDAAALLARIEDKINLPLNAPDLDVSINELWTQRFEDNGYRAKQRLDDKLIRVTGAVENISERSFSISGARSQIGPVNMVVNLNDAYAAKIQEGLASLETGTPITVQGRFSFGKMWLSDAVFVNRNTGRVLLSADMKELSKTDSTSPRPAAKK